MTRRHWWLTLGLAAAGLLSCCAVSTLLKGGHVDIEAAELQARIAPRFPTRHCKLALACLELANPVVVLQDGDNRIGLTADAKVTLGTRERVGRVGLAGRPRYEPAEGQLFVDDLQITTLELAGLSAEAAELLKANGALLVRRALQSHPVYTLDAHTAQGALAKGVLKDVQVVNGKLRLSFG